MLTAKDEDVIVSGYNEHNTAVIIPFGNIMGDYQSFVDLGEPRAIIDNSDEGSSQGVDRFIVGELEAPETGRVNDSIGVESPEQFILLRQEVTRDMFSDELGALCSKNGAQPVHVGVSVDCGRQVLIRIHNSGFLVDRMLLY